MSFEDVIEVNGKKYFASQEAPIQTDLTSHFLNKWVISRSYVEGVNFGFVLAADETGVLLKDARRLWRHSPADESLSWYEGVAVSGLSNNAENRVSNPVNKLIMEDYSLTECTEVAIKSLIEFETNRQSD